MIAEVGGMVKVSGSRMATPLAPPSPGQHADDGAEDDADHRHEEVERRDRDLKAEEEVLDAHRFSSPSQASSGPLGIGTRNHTSKTRKVTTGNADARERRSSPTSAGRSSACRRPGRARRRRRARRPASARTTATAGQSTVEDRPSCCPGDEGRVGAVDGRPGQRCRAQATTMISGEPEREEAALGPVGAPADAEPQRVADDEAAQTRISTDVPVTRSAARIATS